MAEENENYTPDRKEFLSDTLELIKGIGYVRPDEIPDIGLYMDQVTTFLDDKLQYSRRRETDKLLTKTMINNYTKADLLPPPEKKRYSREHMMTLIFIYYFKNFLSIRDIQTILKPLTDKYFENENGQKMKDIYAEVFRTEYRETQKQLHVIAKDYQTAQEMFSDFPEEDQDFLHTFGLICQLSFDIYLKKTIIEKLIDEIEDKNESAAKKADD